MPITAVVTGAAGHVGANLVRSLIERKVIVRALVHRQSRAIDGLDVEAIRGDIVNPDSLRDAFQKADIVFHLAADISLSYKHRLHTEAVNVTGTRNVIDACLAAGVSRLVHLSSIHAMCQRPFGIPVDESRELVRSNDAPPYDCTKANGEREVSRAMAEGLDAVIISPTAIVGPYDYQPSHFGSALIAMTTGKLPALVSGGFDWVDVRDVVEGIIKAAEAAPTGTKYILSGHWLSMRDIALLLHEITGRNMPGLTCPLWLARLGTPIMSRRKTGPGGRPLYTRVSLKALESNRNVRHDRASADLNYRPRPFRQTLVDTLQWFRENGQLPAAIQIPAGDPV